MTNSNEALMKEMSKIAIEIATSDLARKAREFANTIPKDLSGKDALIAFANAIDANNNARYGTGKGNS